MLLAVGIHPALALVLFSCLLLAAAAPLALGWARVIPADDPDESPPAPKPAVFLLVLVSLSYLAKLPGLPTERLQIWFLGYFPPPWALWISLAGQGILILFPAVAALYAVVRTGTLSQSLLWGGLLVALLWFVSPFLLANMLGAGTS